MNTGAISEQRAPLQSCAITSKEAIMVLTKLTSASERCLVSASEAKKDAQRTSRVYHTPQLHVVGSATELVQGGGGSYADNNRARQY
jgi:hypothetical protein